MSQIPLAELYKVYIKWLSVPSADRKPATVKEFAERYNLSTADLLSFQEEKTFGDDLMRETMKWAKRKTPMMLHTLYDKYLATKAPQDLKIWQDAIKDAEENQKHTSLEDLIEEFEVTPVQLLQISSRIIKKFKTNELQ